MPPFADKVKRLDRSRLLLRRRYGEPLRLIVTHPVEHVLRAILAEEASAAQVDQAIERFRRHFVDMNDLRVSHPREIREALGADFPRATYKARIIPRLLDQVFKQHNSMVWDFLEPMGKMEVRDYFERLEDVRPFIAAILARDCAGAHTFPVDNDVARVFGRLGILDSAAETETEMQAFLERAVKASRAYEAHWLIKRLAEDLCLPDKPRCERCPLNAFCPSVVLAAKKKAASRGKAGAKKQPKSKAAAKPERGKPAYRTGRSGDDAQKKPAYRTGRRR